MRSPRHPLWRRVSKYLHADWLGWQCREPDTDPQPAAVTRPERDRAAMHFGHLRNDGQAETGACRSRRAAHDRNDRTPASRSSSGMPGPVSSTTTCTVSASRATGGRYAVAASAYSGPRCRPDCSTGSAARPRCRDRRRPRPSWLDSRTDPASAASGRASSTTEATSADIDRGRRGRCRVRIEAGHRQQLLHQSRGPTDALTQTLERACPVLVGLRRARPAAPAG